MMDLRGELSPLLSEHGSKIISKTMLLTNQHCIDKTLLALGSRPKLCSMSYLSPHKDVRLVQNESICRGQFIVSQMMEFCYITIAT